MTNPVSLPSLYFMYDIPLLLDFLKRFFIAHTIGTDLLNPSPVPRSRTFQLFLIYSPNCPIFGTIATSSSSS
jgi:hypothetical protein